MVNKNPLVISTRDPLTLITFEEVIAEIESSLFNLKDLASKINFENADERLNYHNNVSFLKRFYERAERIARDG